MSHSLLTKFTVLCLLRYMSHYMIHVHSFFFALQRDLTDFLDRKSLANEPTAVTNATGRAAHPLPAVPRKRRVTSSALAPAWEGAAATGTRPTPPKERSPGNDGWVMLSP